MTNVDVFPDMCSFDGVYDVRPLLDAVARGRMAGPLQLSGVASTLEVTHLQPPSACRASKHAAHQSLHLVLNSCAACHLSVLCGHCRQAHGLRRRPSIWKRLRNCWHQFLRRCSS